MTSETTRIPHDGGENPVREGETLAHVWFRAGDDHETSGDGEDFRWSHNGWVADIIAYAVTPERAPSPPAKAPTMDAVEAVALLDPDVAARLALVLIEVGMGERSAQDAFAEVQSIIAREVAAARPFIAAECAYIAEWSQYASPDEIATAIKETIR